MESFEDMLREYDGLEETGFEQEFSNDNDCGYVHKWFCRIVFSDRYGSEPIVEFYSLDTNQFVADYYATTLLGQDGYGAGYGHSLDLYGSCRSWTIDAEDLDIIREWVEGSIEQL